MNFAKDILRQPGELHFLERDSCGQKLGHALVMISQEVSFLRGPARFPFFKEFEEFLFDLVEIFLQQFNTRNFFIHHHILIKVGKI